MTKTLSYQGNGGDKGYYRMNLNFWTPGVREAPTHPNTSVWQFYYTTGNWKSFIISFCNKSPFSILLTWDEPWPKIEELNPTELLVMLPVVKCCMTRPEGLPVKRIWGTYDARETNHSSISVKLEMTQEFGNSLKTRRGCISFLWPKKICI